MGRGAIETLYIVCGAAAFCCGLYTLSAQLFGCGSPAQSPFTTLTFIGAGCATLLFVAMSIEMLRRLKEYEQKLSK